MTEFLLLLLQLPWFLLKAAVIIIGWSTLFLFNLARDYRR